MCGCVVFRFSEDVEVFAGFRLVVVIIGAIGPHFAQHSPDAERGGPAAAAVVVSRVVVGSQTLGRLTLLLMPSGAPLAEQTSGGSVSISTAALSAGLGLEPDLLEDAHQELVHVVLHPARRLDVFAIERDGQRFSSWTKIKRKKKDQRRGACRRVIERPIVLCNNETCRPINAAHGDVNTGHAAVVVVVLI